MLSPEISVLISSAAVIAFVHTLMGPDHYLPFVSMGVARRWSIRKMLLITAGCGLGHIVGSIALGFAGVALQLQLGSLEWFESLRGDVAAWCLIAFGLVYFSWGLRNAYKNKPHSHLHSHGELLHEHDHKHHNDHAHVHTKEAAGKLNSIGPWAIFIIFVLGPCEPLIPLMFAAVIKSWAVTIAVCVLFTVITLLMMVVQVLLIYRGVAMMSFPKLEAHGHTIAGLVVVFTGAAVMVLSI